MVKQKIETKRMLKVTVRSIFSLLNFLLFSLENVKNQDLPTGSALDWSYFNGMICHSYYHGSYTNTIFFQVFQLIFYGKITSSNVLRRLAAKRESAINGENSILTDIFLSSCLLLFGRIAIIVMNQKS